ncbi:MAG TPA: UDP-N-acetylglucosamine diphosphorylase, partial [Verrucomicrobiota bacterium]|nr:UDP-N-acetylglucosamine diphosphorylase [Verrucomicrobiota bacterium]
YVGDSVLGYHVHLGAGVMLSNYRLIRGNVNVRVGDRKIDSGLAKFGALIGDRTEIGCNAVLNPGTIIGRDCVLYPNVTFTGVLPAKRLVKNKTELAVVEKREAAE